MVLYGMVWYGMVWYGMLRYNMVWYGVIEIPLGRKDRTDKATIINEVKFSL
jgi:hypothetical protein